MKPKHLAGVERVVLASGNTGKIKEIGALLKTLGVEVVPQSEVGIPEAEETGLSFVENAIIKARHAALHTQLPAIADDSGLEVDALGGAPGVFSARYAGPAAKAADNNAKLLRALEGLPSRARNARFRSVIVFMRHHADASPLIAEGSWEGRILESPRGEGGFGYDPLFLVAGKNASAAELPPEEKNRLSHRGQALRRLLAALSAE